MKETKYTAIYMPATDGDSPTKNGFATEDEAWEYIYSRRCDSCKENPEWDMCSADWDVCTDEEWESYGNENK